MIPPSPPLPLATLGPGERYSLSCPSRKERCAELAAGLAPFPLLVATAEGELAAGHDFGEWLLARDGPLATAPVWVLPPLPEVEVLRFGYRWRERFVGLNPAEKLLFVRRIAGRISPAELRRQTGFDLPLTPPLLARLDTLLAEPFVSPLAAARISVSHAVTLAGCAAEEARPLLDLLAAIPFSSGDQRNLIDWSRQAARRLDWSLAEVVSLVAPPATRSAEMPQKQILAALRRLRFPEAMAAGDRWREEMGTRKLPAGTELRHDPFFEKGEIELRMRFATLDDALAGLRRLEQSSAPAG